MTQEIKSDSQLREELRQRRIVALLLSSNSARKYAATVDGQRIVSDGRMMLLSDVQTKGIEENAEPIIKLWNRYAADEAGDTLAVTKAFRFRADNGKNAVAAQLSNGQFVNMAYIALLAECEMRQVKGAKLGQFDAYTSAICGFKDGKLFGVVMPLNRTSTSMGEEVDPASLTEKDMYGMFSCAENGFYPLSGAEIDAALIASLEKELEEEMEYLAEKENERDEADAEVDATEGRIAELRKKLAFAKKEVAA